MPWVRIQPARSTACPRCKAGSQPCHNFLPIKVRHRRQCVEMESLAALSLACNVVQLIQFSCHTTHVCKQIYEDESLAANVGDHCEDLQASSTKVKASITAASGGSSQPPASDGSSINSDQQLLSIANKLITIANDLNTELAVSARF